MALSLGDEREKRFAVLSTYTGGQHLPRQYKVTNCLYFLNQ
nr:MAG TPA: hypothetical protein [Caudoviricetes sp.]